MDFMTAMDAMGKGKTIKRPLWSGYLYLDIDKNIKHAGQYKDKDEAIWNLDLHANDWEEYMTIDLKSEEISESRMESLLDQNSSNIKRLYYLEEMIEGQHKAFKKISEEVKDEMEYTRKTSELMTKFVSSFEKRIKQLEDSCNNIVSVQINFENTFKSKINVINNSLDNILQKVKESQKKNDKKESKELKEQKEVKEDIIVEEKKSDENKVEPELSIRKKIKENLKKGKKEKI